MKKIDDQFIEELKKKGCSGDLEKIELGELVKNQDLEIVGCEFVGVNKIYGKVKLLRSTFKDSSLLGHDYISDSKILNSLIGTCTIVEDFSEVKNSTTSSLAISEAGGISRYPILVGGSQINSDVIFGGCDFSKTKSRGGSIFAFAHIGGGEFIRSTIIGTSPTEVVKNSLVEVGHFGYYGDLTALGLAVRNSEEKYIDPTDELFYSTLAQAFSSVYLNIEQTEDFKIERGRANFGAGTSISNYDPIRGTKAGATFILSSCGVGVALSPYLTVLPGSLIATGSVDITRELNVIVPDSLFIGARAETVYLEGYLDDLQRRIMNDRTKEEVDYLIQDLKIRGALADFFANGTKSLSVSESLAFLEALKLTSKTAKKLAEKTLPKYLKLLKDSIDALDQKSKLNPEKSTKYSEKKARQVKVEKQSEVILKKASEVVEKIETLIENIDEQNLGNSEEQKLSLVLTEKQADRLDGSTIDIGDL